MLPSEKRATPDSRGVLAVEDWAEIRRLNRAEGLSGRAIARRLGVSRGAVARALASADRPRYSRPPRGSAVDAFEPAIRQLLAEFPSMPASVIAERVGWLRSSSVLRDRVAPRPTSGKRVRFRLGRPSRRVARSVTGRAIAADVSVPVRAGQP
jgi:hypothetical protein